MRKFLLASLLLCCMALPGLAQEQVEELSFQPGATHVQVKRGIARGESMRFLLGASGGQTMTVVVQSVEQNAEFEVWGDGGQLGTSQLVGAKQKWGGVLPGHGAGTYAVVVGSSRGGAEFNLYVEIR